MQNMDISLEDPRWDAVDFDALALAAVRATLTYLQVDWQTSEVSILACDDARIATLNADFRDKPTPTNVLSWPSEERAAMSDGGMPEPPEPGPDGAIELGDIAIAYETCVAEATAHSKLLADHITHLMVHATLHLLGFDHETTRDAALMEGLEVKILGKMGLNDPYRDS
ncbi:putative rRNA maturation factor [Sulfitobacter noctilucae]|uniref:rRNA maturation RNase YbeY n=1 Tax=Sulfitobacter noctilucae TaxID=1342302 RepID=UPI00046971FC|nr:rRNA maturation RNase YbeY [Sulfitobacter noctilucae]KIN70896.1 putative rRNA maturation factor [Sulfitobacter noctilucae]